MSIKSDKWIRRMAVSDGMIEPFEPGQVRERAGERIVSYGTSSYGYDVRCAADFKVFTNISSTTVDPKAFDENTISNGIVEASSLTEALSLGPETGETTIDLFDDIDDNNGYKKIDSL